MESLVNVLSAIPLLFFAVVAIFGLCIGSFLNVVIHRLPVIMEREWQAQLRALESEHGTDPSPPASPYTLSRPRSACPSCERPIRAHENIPVISYMMLGGRCAGCGSSISMRYPVIEIFTAILSVLVAARFGVSVETLAALGLTWSLIALAGIDNDTQLLPDSITLPLLWAGLLLSVWSAQSLVPDPATAIIGAAAGYLSLWSVYHLFRIVTGKEGMGYGDFKLLAALGAWLGWQRLPLIILLSAVVGAAVGIALIMFRRHGRDVPIPYGPYLAAAGWVALMWGEQITRAYLNFAGLS